MNSPEIRSTKTESTHSDDCYKWHHQCAITRLETLQADFSRVAAERDAYKAALECIAVDSPELSYQQIAHLSMVLARAALEQPK